MQLPSNVYDVLKWGCLILLPAAAALLATVLPVFGIPAETVNNVCLCVNAGAVFIGACIGVSTVNYNRSGDEK